MTCGDCAPWLSKYGLSLEILETSEVLGNVTGGVNQGFDYDGLTQMLLQLDTQRAFRLVWRHLQCQRACKSMAAISARTICTTLQTASGIEADRATRLWELWYQQKFLEEDRLDVKIGQQSLDQEFMVSQNALLFRQHHVRLADAAVGGSARRRPGLSAVGAGRAAAGAADRSADLPGRRLQRQPGRQQYGDPQKQNPSGTSFPLNGGALAIAELQYAYPVARHAWSCRPSRAAGADLQARRLVRHARSLPISRFDNTRPVARQPRQHRHPADAISGDYAIYAVADQMVWRDPNEPDRDRTINVFARAMGTPEEDRNLIDFSLNAGLTFHEPFLHRDDDTFGIGMGYAHVSSRASGSRPGHRHFYTAVFYPVRSSETFVEATYQYQVTPWWQLQPDFQYVFNPGRRDRQSERPATKVKNEAVLGLRTNILF